MMKRTMLLVFAAIAIPAAAAHAVFEIDSDSVNVDFGLMDAGSAKELQERGVFQNEVTCTSSTGNIWYLKIYAIDDFRSGQNTMESTCLKWRVTTIDNGHGYLTSQSNIFNELQTIPTTMYTSGQGDAAGTAVRFKIAYALEVPKSQPAGNYRTTIRFVFTEIL